MFEISCFDQYGKTLTSLTQWDINQTLYIENWDYPNPVFHFCNTQSTESLPVTGELKDGTVTVNIPNILLTQAYTIIAYVYIYDDNSGRTMRIIRIPVRSKPKPDEYEYEENISGLCLEQLDARITALVNSTASGGVTSEQLEIVDARVASDGTTYGTVGDAIRMQIYNLGEKVTALGNRTDFYTVEFDEETRFLHFYDESYGDVYDPVYIPGGGSGGSSGSGGNNAVITLTNTSGWLSSTVAQESSCIIKANWSSLENEIPTGVGTLTVRVNNSSKLSKSIEQGDISVDIKDYLSSGSNNVKLTVSDTYGNSRTINFSVTVVSISLSSTFDTTAVFSDAITFTYIPTGNIEKTVHFILDGTEIGTATTAVSGRQQNYQIPAQTHGAHTLRVYFVCSVGENTIQSNELYYELACIEDGNTTPIITSNWTESSIVQYTSVPITYRVYDPQNMSTEVKLYVNGALASTQTVDRTEQTWTYRADTVGTLALQIDASNSETTVSKKWNLTVTQSNIDVAAETENLSLYLSSYGRSNNEDNPAIWKYNDISATFTNFNFSSDGWLSDDDKITVLHVSGDARLEIPLKIFAQDFRSTGKTIEIEFSTSEVMDYDAVILSCMSENRGIQLTAQKATLKSEQSEIFTSYKEDEHVRISFVIEKKSENRLIQCYINGIMSGAIQYPADDDFSQKSPVNISIGSNDCAVNLYCIRVYDNDLTRYQILDNWIADTQNITDMLTRYTRNNLFDAYGSIIIDNLPTDLPYLVFESADLPTYKGDKKTVSGYYVDPQNSDRSFTFKDAQIDVQGTSSAGYERKNFKVKFKGGFVINGVTEKKYALRGSSISIPTSTFTFKADVASSEGANNVELVRLYNDICPYKTPPQETDNRIRQGIDGFPIVIFQDDGKDVTFIGKYNFNNDKGTDEVYGFSEGDESWEILNNTSSRVNWKSPDYAGDDWLNDFEGRYPDGNIDPTNLAKLAEWINSTDQAAATNKTLETSVEYDGVTYTSDTAGYRLAKFKNEVSNHFEKDDLLFNYLFTELFLMVDNRAKNAFPTFFNGHNWIIFPYDYDTALGINNEGALVFDYSLEDTDTVDGANVYNGQESVLWVNVRNAFYDELASMYKTLRADGKFSYSDTEQRFEDHQGKWPEAIFNEDAWFKYLAPLVEKGNAAYLSMLQGAKTEQRKWWLYNRYRYIDSKYNAGDALSDFIMIRAYSKENISVTPYADIYATIKYGSYTVQKRALRGNTYTLECPLDTFNDTEVYIYSSSQLKSVGDLSGLMVGYADFSKATRLQSLKLGDSSSDYSNQNMKELYLGNNTLLKEVDLRNCPNLTQAIDLSGCTNLEYVYFDGTNVPSISLPVGGILKTLHLPASITNLTIRNQKNITELVIPSYKNITTLRLENVGDSIDINGILKEIQANSRVRIIGFSWTFESAEDAISLLDILDTMRGLDENGNNTDKAQVSGTIYVSTLTGAQLASIQRYSSIKVIYDHITSYCYFYNYDGTTLLYTAACADGANASYSGSTPTRSSTAQYTYSFSGWGLSPEGNASSTALNNVTADRKVYAIFSATIRTYTVYFYNGNALLQTVTNVAYGGSATYTGTTPEKSGVSDPTNYEFKSWSPSPIGITGNTSCYAQYKYIGLEDTIADSWVEIIMACADGTYADKYSVGDTKILDLDTESVCMQIAAFDADDKADGSGKAPISWISKQLLADSHRISPSLITNYEFKSGASFDRSSFSMTNTNYNNWIAKNNYSVNNTAKITFVVTAVTDGTLRLSFVTGTEAQYTTSLKINGAEVISSYSASSQSYNLAITSGTTYTIVYENTPRTSSATANIYIKLCNTNGSGTKANVEALVTQDSVTIDKCSVRSITGYTEGTGAIGGWEKSEIRAYLKDTIKSRIPENVRNAIIEVTKTQPAYDTAGYSFTQTTADDVWIPSRNEITGSSSLYYPLFQDTSENRIKYKVGKTSADSWWLRTSGSNYSFYITTNIGANNNLSNSSYEYNSVVLCFCT